MNENHQVDPVYVDEAKYSLIVSRAAVFFLAWVLYIWLCVQDVAVCCCADGMCKAWDAWDA